ncbi:protein fem-1 homolog A-A-like [Lepeophtheirus salmonis]|uniref:protein fem-1 homolog A-A-like n=1 Tax=Lepeophtheirus salmonis TaxID=72036 RepID=UPI003AF37BF0
MSERILGEDHKDTIFRYMYCGASHADVNQYNECVHLWNYALKLKIRKDTLLSYDSSFTARAIVQLYVNILRSVFRSDNENMSMSEIREECEVSFKDVLSTTIFINEGLVKALQLLKVNPVFQVQLDNLDIILTSWIHLIHILLKMAISEEEMRQIYLIVKEVLSIDPKTSNGGDSVFHLAVSSSSTLKSNSFLDEENAPLFPSLELTKFILKCDFDVHKRNNLGETPLHIASKPANYSKEVIELLLSHQCHADVPDSNGLRALDLLVQQTYNLSLVSHISLKCLAAQVLRRNRMSEKTMPLRNATTRRKSPARTMTRQRSSLSRVVSTSTNTSYKEDEVYEMLYKKNANVLARWPGTSLYYKAVVTYVRDEDNEYDVKYEDGTVFSP